MEVKSQYTELQLLVQQYEVLVAAKDKLAESSDNVNYRALPEYKEMKRALYELWKRIQECGERRSTSPVVTNENHIETLQTTGNDDDAITTTAISAFIEDEDIDLGKQAPPHAWLLTMVQTFSQVASAQLTCILSQPTQSCL